MKAKLAILVAAAAATAAPAAASETIVYSYDARGRLVKVEHNGVVNNGVSTAYSFDKADNRMSVATTGVSEGYRLIPVSGATPTSPPAGVIVFPVKG